MQELADMELLREYAHRNSETAFAGLVGRHINMVYSTALRKTGNPNAAEEITQAVFIILAKKAGALREKTILSGWLYQTARMTAANFIRTEIRRVRREQEAYMRSLADESESEIWPEIVPLLDDAMGRLTEKDRNAVALRFFEGKSFLEIGTAFGTSENAAKKRVNYALEKLRRYFSKRGVALTTGIIAGAISASSVQAAPITLAESITAVAVVKGATAGSSTLTLIKGALKIMAWAKAKTIVVTGVVAVLLAGTATVTVQKIEQHHADESWRTGMFNSDILDRVSPQVNIFPAKSSQGGGYGSANEKIMGIHADAGAMMRMAYEFWSPTRMVLATELPPGHYDFIANLPRGNQRALQAEIKKQFGLTARREDRETNVLFLTVKVPNAPGLKPPISRMGSGMSSSMDTFSAKNQPISCVASLFESNLGVPVIDKTGLTQNFNLELKWGRNDPQHGSLKQVVLDHLGLELVPGRESIPVLIIEKAAD